MTVEVEGPGGVIVEFPDGTPSDTIRRVMAGRFGGPQSQPGGQPAPEPEPQSWGEIAKGLGREALQGATFDFSDELGLTDRAASERFGAQYPIASTVARLAGGVAPFVAGPGAAVARLAIGRTLPRTIARSAGVGAGAGALSGAGAGEGDIRTSEGLESRLESARMGGLFGAGIGAAAPPVIGALGMGARAVGNVASRLTQPLRTPAEPPLPFSAFDRPRGGPPVEGARFVNDMTPGEVANAQTRALGSIRDALLREGTTPAQIEAQLEEFATWASRFHSQSYGQDVVTPADLSQGLQRLLGSLARQSPEAARDISTLLQARQTGMTPAGADAGRLGQRGIPSQDRFSRPMTGAQAAEEFGPAFQRAPSGHLRTGAGNLQTMGHFGRVMDGVKRALHLKDDDFHGHAANPGRTMDDINTSMRADARRSYGVLYRLGERVDLRPAITPVITRIEALAATSQPPRSTALARVAALFRQRDGQVVRDIKNFDLYGKQYLDDEIGKAFRAGDNAIGNELKAIRDELFAALRTSDPRTKVIARLYDRARSDYNTDSARQELIERFRGIWKGDPRRLVEEYATLSGGDQKLARLGVLWGAEDQAAGQQLSRNITGLFNTPKAQQILAAIVPRTETATGRVRMRGGAPAEFADTPQRLGAYLDIENLFPETRNVAIGGSQTARNVQDDLMQTALDASQNIQGLVNAIQGNQSIYQLVERVLKVGYDRWFGVGADAAREATRMLLTANPAERAEMLRQVAAIMPADRMARFNELTQRLRGSIGTSASGTLGGSAGAPQGGPVSL